MVLMLSLLLPLITILAAVFFAEACFKIAIAGTFMRSELQLSILGVMKACIYVLVA